MQCDGALASYTHGLSKLKAGLKGNFLNSGWWIGDPLFYFIFFRGWLFIRMDFRI